MSDILRLYDDATGTLAAMRTDASRYAKGKILPLDQSSSDTTLFPSELWQEMGQQGLLGVTAPDQYGGFNLGYLAHVLIAEQVSMCSGSIGLNYIAHSNLCVNQIALNGTDEQKAAYLPKLMTGEYVEALSRSEDTAGSDVIGEMKTCVIETDGGFGLNGRKLWITNGDMADVLVVYVETDMSDDKVTAFLVIKDMEVFKVGQKIHKNGMRGSDTYELIFDNFFIPKENALGTVHGGAAVLMSGLNYEYLVLSAGALSLA